MLDGPSVGMLSWYVTITCPSGPTTMSPKLPALEPGTSSGEIKLPTWPSPVTGAPRAWRGLVLLKIFHVTQTLPAPVVTVGWSTGAPHLLASGLPWLFVCSTVLRNLKVTPPSVLNASWTSWALLSR